MVETIVMHDTSRLVISFWVAVTVYYSPEFDKIAVLCVLN